MMGRVVVSWGQRGQEVSGECWDIAWKEDEVLLHLCKHTWTMMKPNKVPFSGIAKGKIKLEVKGGNEAFFLYEVIICSCRPQATVLIIYCASGKIMFCSSFGLG